MRRKFGEMAQWVRVPAVKSRGPEFKSPELTLSPAFLQVSVIPASEDGDFWVLEDWWLICPIKTISFRFSERPCHKYKMESNRWRCLMSLSGLCVCVHEHTCPCTRTHPSTTYTCTSQKMRSKIIHSSQAWSLLFITRVMVKVFSSRDGKSVQHQEPEMVSVYNPEGGADGQ